MSYQDTGQNPYGGAGDFGPVNLSLGKIIGLLVLAVIVGAFIFVWYFCRISVGKGEFVPLMKKTGKVMTNEMIVDKIGEFRGPQYEILKEGRYFRNPYHLWWPRPMKATEIPALHVGVMVRLYGNPLPPGEVIAHEENQKGILEELLGVGRKYVNLWAYKVEQHPMVLIEPGFRGVVTRLVGQNAEDPNVFVVAEGERGTQPFLLRPGTHPKYSNPYVYMVTSIDTRSQKFEMAGVYGITFPSKYGFDIKVEGTIEWAPDEKKLSEVFVKYVDEADLRLSGGIDNIQRKIILPFARSFFRTIGGGHQAVDYITGETRIKVQNQVEQRLREACADEGVLIKSFVIRATEPPRAIRDQYERREISLREVDRYQKEILTEVGDGLIVGGKPKLDADGKPILDKHGNPILIGGKPKLDVGGKIVREGGRLAKVIQERRKDRESKFGGIREKIAVEIRSAQQYKAVETTKAEKDLAVAKVMLEAAKDKAAKVMAEGMAKAAVMVMKNKAEAEAVKAKVSAFGEGAKYAEYQLIVKLAPGIKKVLSNTDGPFARLFERFAALAGSSAEKENK